MTLYLTNIVCPKLLLYDLVLTQPCVFSSFGVYDIRLSAIDELGIFSLIHNVPFPMNLLHIRKMYRVFIKYCVFSKLFEIFRTLFSLGVSVCTLTRQVEHQRCNRTGRVQKNHKILRKKHNI